MRALLACGTVELASGCPDVAAGPPNMRSRWSQKLSPSPRLRGAWAIDADSQAAWEPFLSSEEADHAAADGKEDAQEEKPSADGKDAMEGVESLVADDDPSAHSLASESTSLKKRSVAPSKSDKPRRSQTSDDALGIAVFMRAAGCGHSNNNLEALAVARGRALEDLHAAAMLTSPEAKDIDSGVVQRGYSAVLAIMEASMATVEVQESGCRLIAALMAGRGKIILKQSDMTCQTVRTVLRSMSAQLTARGVQEAACWVLKEAAANTTASLPDDVLSAAVRAVLRAMQEHSAHAGLQVVACGVIRNITAMKTEWQSRVLELGGCNTIIRAMQHFQDDSPVQWAGTWALFCLAIRNCKAVEMIRKSGGVEAVSQAMTLHKMDAKVQEAGCWALRELAVHDTRSEIAAWTEHVRLISRAMKTHNTKDMRDAGTAALRRLSMRGREELARSPQPKRSRITKKGSLPTIQECEDMS